MSMRFGGKYSPQGGVSQPDRPRARPDALPPGPAPRHRFDSRVTWLTVAAFPFLIGAFFQPVTGMVADLAAFGVFAAGMAITREGLRAESAYDARRVARRPAVPRKLFGGILTGLGLALGAYVPGAEIGAALIGAAGMILHVLAFGPDPMRDKGMEGIDSFQQDRVARVIDEGEAYLSAMKDAILRTNDRALAAHVDRFAATARGLFRRVEEDPRDLTAARRYLGVYLLGARDATVKFTDLYTQTRNPADRAAYEALLTDLETNFAARTRSLIESGRSDMEVEMEVLRDRLLREGVRPADTSAAPLLTDSPEPTAEQVLGQVGQDLKLRRFRD